MFLMDVVLPLLAAGKVIIREDPPGTVRYYTPHRNLRLTGKPLHRSFAPLCSGQTSRFIRFGCPPSTGQVESKSRQSFRCSMQKMHAVHAHVRILLESTEDKSDWLTLFINLPSQRILLRSGGFGCCNDDRQSLSNNRNQKRYSLADPSISGSFGNPFKLLSLNR